MFWDVKIKLLWSKTYDIDGVLLAAFRDGFAYFSSWHL